MSSYPPNQNPDSEINLDSMGPWQKAALFSNPKALQIMAYVQDIGARREEQQRRRELYKMEIEDRQRARAHDDFKTAIALHDSGFLPVHPGMVGQFEAGMGGRGTVTAPDMKQYSVPTEGQKFQRAAAQAAQAGTLEGIKSKATEDVTNPYEDISLPEEIGGGTARVAKKDKVKTLLDIYKTAHPHRAFHATQPNDKGEVTIWSVDPANGDVRTEKTITNAGKTARPAAGSESIPDFDKQVKTLMDSWREGYYAQVGITPKVVKAAKGPGEVGPFGSSNPAASRIHQADEVLYKRAVDSLKNQAKGSRPGVTVTPPPTETPQAHIARVAKLGKPMPAKNVPAAAKGLGISVEEFSRLWRSAGGTIAP